MSEGIRNKANITFQHTKQHIIRYTTGAVLAVFVAGAAYAPVAYAASKYDAQIKQLKQQNTGVQSQKNDLADQAGSLSEKLAGIQAAISSLETQIAATQAKDRKIQADIAANEAELAKQKATLADNIKQMYIEDDMSTLEMVASSKNLSEFMDREEYRTAVQNNITETMDKIKTLQQQLADQKAQVEHLLTDQQSMQGQLDAQRAENARLLSLNQDQQSSLNQTMQTNSSKIAQLQKLQAQENARYNIGKPVTGGTGSYPWANAPWPNEIPDTWGMYERQCVSYTAWKVASTGRYMPYWGGRGNAKNWDDNARGAGIPVDTNPHVGDVAISNAGTYGHAMYVEAVNGDGTITVSQYNASWDGKYSVAKRAVTGLAFIHF